ncbi:TatD family hydrolase [Candidatus Parcubacteria bacterium]|nr:TatD family hydrolase [Candidatus Parcubacteria bacterium]
MKFDEDRDEVIQAMKESKIGTITVGTDLKNSKEAVDLANKHENLFTTIGLHPNDNHEEEFVAEEYEKLVQNKKVVAIGECGLDYARLENPEAEKKRQKGIFDQQIEFAVKHDKPLMIHCRDAYDDCLAILKSKQQIYGQKVRGNFHFFTSPVEIAKQCLEIGFTVSFTGPITFVSEYAEVVKYVPLEKMMAETDAPFAAPMPYRGQRNSPLYVQHIVKRMAEIKDLSLETVKKQLILNTFDLFLNKAS